MRIRHAVATITVATLVGVGASVAPFASTQPAYAASSKLENWANALSKTFTSAGKVFGIEKSIGFLAGSGVLTFAGPLISMLLTDSGPSLGDVMSKLGDVENQLASVQQDLDAIDSEVRQADLDALMGTCDVETSELTDLLTDVESAQNEYNQMISQMKTIDDMSDVENLKKQTDGFVQTVFGAGKTSQTFIDGTDLGAAILAAHNRLVSTGGSHGVIEACGKAYLDDWRNRTASPSAIAAASTTAAGAWVGDEEYYSSLQDLVMYWQTVQAQAVYLLQQAAYLQAVQGYATEVAPLTTEEAAHACSSVQKGSDAYALCASTLTFTQNFRADIVTQWEQAGVPYSDDDVVLALGSDVTGIASSTAIPSRLWARNPDAFGDGAAQATPQGPAGAFDTTFAGWSGWSPAGSTEWNQLAAGLTASHQGTAGQKMSARQEIDDDADTYDAFGVQPFAPVDVLSAMAANQRANGSGQFSVAGSIYWLPQETATSAHRNLYFPSAPLFANSYDMPDMPDVVKHPMNSWYAGPDLPVACMVIPIDGVLCGDDIVSRWWAGRQESDYTLVSANWFTHNYTGAATWSVAPSSDQVPALQVSGQNSGCNDRLVCMIPVNEGVGSMPPWVLAFLDASGTVHDPAVDAADTYTQRVWPVLDLPTDPGCTTVWGVPTRCGAAMDAWIAANIADPDAAVPEASADPAVAVGDAPDTAVCNAPSWADGTLAGGQTVSYGDVTWTAADASGRTLAVDKPWGTAVSVTNDIAPASSWPAGTTGFALACSVSATVSGDMGSLDLTSSAVPVALIDGSWQVGASPKATVTDSPDATTAPMGGSITLTATAAVDPATAAAAATAPGSDSTDSGTASDPDPAPTDSPAPAPDPTDAPSPTPSPTSTPDPTPSPTSAPAALGSGTLPGDVVLASATEPIRAGSAVVRWEKREAGSSEWTPLDLPSAVTVSDGVSGPRALGQHSVTASLTVDAMSGEDDGDAYRAVFVTADGDLIASSEAQVSMQASAWQWVWITGALLLAVGSVVAVVLVSRRRRA